MNNHETLEHAAAIQTSTLEALERMQLDLAETELVASETHKQLIDQHDQGERILHETGRLKAGLDKSNKLFNKLGRFGLRFRTETKARNEVKKLYSGAEGNETNNPGKQGSHHKTGAGLSSYEAKDDKPESRQRSTKSRGKNSSKEATPHCPKTMLEEMGDIERNEHRDELQIIADTDEEINRHLDQIDSQLDGIMNAARVVHDQVHTQTSRLDEIGQRMDEADNEQKVVNHRVRRFMDGKLRNQYTVQDTILSAGRKMALKPGI